MPLEQHLQPIHHQGSIFYPIAQHYLWVLSIAGILLFILCIILLRTLRDRQHKDTLLKRNEERLRLALDGSQDGFWDWNVATDENLVDKQWCQMLGYQPDEIEQTMDQWKRLVHPDDLPTATQTLQKCMNKEFSHFASEFRMKMKDGNWKWVIGRGMVVTRDENQRPLRLVGTHRDINRQKEAEIALKKALHNAETERNKIDAILKSIGDGLMVTGQDNQITLVNQTAKRLLRIDDFDKRPTDSTETVNGTLFTSQLNSILNGDKEKTNIDLEIYDTTLQQTRTIQARFSPIYDINQHPISVITTLQDVTRIREMARLKSEFISTAAHELRTPVTAIMGFAELLIENHELPMNVQQEYLQIITDKSEALSTIVDELLDLSRIEAGRIITLDQQSYPLDTVLLPFINQYRDSCPTHNIITDFHHLQTILLIDKNKLTQAIENILSNAIKYSPDGDAITIRTDKTATDFVISVTDQGIGMSQSQLERIFDKFYRADNTNTAVGGLGIGLSIVKNIIEAHHGTIEINSTLGVGSTATITLPLPTDDNDCEN